MTDTKERRILDAYETWDPNEGPLTGVLEDLDISRQRLYQVLDKYNVTPKTRRKAGDAKYDDQLLSEMAENALSFLLNQIHELRDELQSYREKYGPL